jgi:hypothetical protein
VLDASSKSPSGLLDGTLTSFGDYDQCLEMKTGDDVFPAFVGKYCSIEMTVITKGEHFWGNISKIIEKGIPAFGSSNLQFGLCFPSLCTENDIEILLKKSRYKNHHRSAVSH